MTTILRQIFRVSTVNTTIMEEKRRIVVFTCTYYASADDVRLECCLSMLRLAASLDVRVVVVDDSSTEIRETMQKCGERHVIRKQESKGKKGVAMREAIRIALQFGDFLCWQEAEKVDMIRHWSSIPLAEVDVLVPARREDLFRSTYPLEQYHSESFANMLVGLAVKRLGYSHFVDWHFGPFGFRKELADLWLDHDGELWDAQILPVIQAIKNNRVVRSVTVPFSAPVQMKNQEEGNLAFAQKRLMQINFLIPKILQDTQS